MEATREMASEMLRATDISLSTVKLSSSSDLICPLVFTSSFDHLSLVTLRRNRTTDILRIWHAA